MASDAFKPVRNAADVELEGMKQTVADGEKQRLSPEEKIRRLKEKGEKAKQTFNDGVDSVIANAAKKDPGPNATPDQKAKYDLFLNEITNMMDDVSKWIGWLFEKVWEAINKIIDWFRRAVQGVINYSNEVFNGIQSWWSSLW